MDMGKNMCKDMFLSDFVTYLMTSGSLSIDVSDCHSLFHDLDDMMHLH